MKKIPDISFPTLIVLFFVAIICLTVVFPKFFLENIISVFMIGITVLLLFRAFHISLLSIVVYTLCSHFMIGILLYANLALSGTPPPDFIDFISVAHMTNIETMTNQGIEQYGNTDPLMASEGRYKLLLGALGEFPIFIFLWLSISQLVFILKRDKAVNFEGSEFVPRRNLNLGKNLMALFFALAIMGFILQPLSGTYIPGLVRIMMLVF